MFQVADLNQWYSETDYRKKTDLCGLTLEVNARHQFPYWLNQMGQCSQEWSEEKVYQHFRPVNYAEVDLYVSQ